MSTLLNRDSRRNLLYQRAESEWTADRLQSAFRLFLAAAKADFVPAYDLVAQFYDKCWGVKRNQDAALLWYRRAYRDKRSWLRQACRQGLSVPANNIGCILRDRGQHRSAISWFLRAVRLGDGDANLCIAKIYLRNQRDRPKAIRYLKKTCSASYVTDGSIEEARRLLRQIQKMKLGRRLQVKAAKSAAVGR
jgi:TPR repeat protein